MWPKFAPLLKSLSFPRSPALFCLKLLIAVGTAVNMWYSSYVAAIAALASLATAQYDNEVSPPSYPSPWMRGGNGWDDAYQKAVAFVSQLTLTEKVNLTTGVGWEGIFVLKKRRRKDSDKWQASLVLVTQGAFRD